MKKYDEFKNIPGLFLYQNIFPESVNNEIIEWLDKQEWSNTLSRRTQQYGYTYDYKSRNINPTKPLTSYILKIAKWLKEIGLMRNPNQCIVNEYKKNQGISPHIDNTNFGPVIISISLNDDTNFIMSKDNKTHTIYVPKLSMLVLCGDARYKWKHSIPNRKKVSTNNRNITKDDNYRRISLTYRTVAN